MIEKNTQVPISEKKVNVSKNSKSLLKEIVADGILEYSGPQIA